MLFTLLLLSQQKVLIGDVDYTLNLHPCQDSCGCAKKAKWQEQASCSFQRNTTPHPTAQWTAQQLVEAFPFDSATRYLLRDRDAIYGKKVRRRIRSLGIEEVVTTPRSPWQNPYVERVIGSIRRDCLDHVIVLSERHLGRILRNYFDYYHSCRTHLSLSKNPPDSRAVESVEVGNIVALPRVGRLHHRYTRIAA